MASSALTSSSQSRNHNTSNSVVPTVVISGEPVGSAFISGGFGGGRRVRERCIVGKPVHTRIKTVSDDKAAAG